MKKQDTARLDTHFLVRRLEVLGIKQWWLAAQLKVDRKTVGRWVSGRVKRISRHNLERLGDELGCTLEDLTVRDEADVFATREEQGAAAQTLKDKDLLGLLSPSDNWELAETLIKATMQPNLPLRSLGQLYNLLSVVAWRQGRYEEGIEKADRARDIGKRLDDRGIVLKATLNRATVHSIAGPIGQALAEFQACLAEPERLESRRDHGVALSNVAWCHREAGDFESAIRTQEQSIRIFSALELDYNLAISWASLGQYRTELSHYDEAWAALETAQTHARAAGYGRGDTCCNVYLADIHSLRGELAHAGDLIQDALPKLDTYPVFDLTCLEIIARHARLRGEFDEARRQLEDALERAAPFPMVRATMLLERARLALALAEPEDEARFRGEANDIFRNNGLAKRILERTVSEYGTPHPKDP